MHRFLNVTWLASSLLVILGSGCTGGDDGQTPDPKAVEAKLALADKVDGTVDKVVHKCASCSLGMDGSEANSLEVHGYTMHFCSAGCKAKYAAEPDKTIMALKIDE